MQKWEVGPAFSSAWKMSVPGPFFHTPFMAVSALASTDQYPAGGRFIIETCGCVC